MSRLKCILGERGRLEWFCASIKCDDSYLLQFRTLYFPINISDISENSLWDTSNKAYFERRQKFFPNDKTLILGLEVAQYYSLVQVKPGTIFLLSYTNIESGIISSIWKKFSGTKGYSVAICTTKVNWVFFC